MCAGVPRTPRVSNFYQSSSGSSLHLTFIEVLSLSYAGVAIGTISPVIRRLSSISPRVVIVPIQTIFSAVATS